MGFSGGDLQRKRMRAIQLDPLSDQQGHAVDLDGADHHTTRQRARVQQVVSGDDTPFRSGVGDFPGLEFVAGVVPDPSQRGAARVGFFAGHPQECRQTISLLAHGRTRVRAQGDDDRGETDGHDHQNHQQFEQREAALADTRVRQAGLTASRSRCPHPSPLPQVVRPHPGCRRRFHRGDPG